MGFILAFLLKSPVPSSKKFEWELDDYNEEEDEFLKYFDENGNFIEHIDEPPVVEEEPVKFIYKYKENSEE